MINNDERFEFSNGYLNFLKQEKVKYERAIKECDFQIESLELWQDKLKKELEEKEKKDENIKVKS